MSSDEIRAELVGISPAAAESDVLDARICEGGDRRIAAGRSAVAESTNVIPQARARLIALARRFNAPVTVLRFDPDVTDLLQQYAERGRTDLTAADVRAYAAVMTRDAGADQLRSRRCNRRPRRPRTSPSDDASRSGLTLLLRLTHPRCPDLPPPPLTSTNVRAAGLDSAVRVISAGGPWSSDTSS
ncbi:AAA family ATPase [Streptomyces sp. NPDC059556]|uniref:AAA family ATPase n=1 Tax=Streptomyces sp. NPDC059556 TaxID=3346863 RepID=UPI0036A5B876